MRISQTQSLLWRNGTVKLRIRQMAMAYGSRVSRYCLRMYFLQQVYLTDGCPGSGGKELMEEALKSGADIYLTGDVGHHTGLDAQDQGLTVIDAGHFGIEKIYIAQVMALLRQHFPELLVEAVYQEPFVTL